MVCRSSVGLSRAARSGCSRVQPTVLLVDLDERLIGRGDEQRPTPLLIDDRALRWEAGCTQPPLDHLEWLIGDKVEGDSGASLSVGGDRGVVEAKLTAGRAQLDPVSGSRTRLRLQTEGLVKAHRLGQVWHEMDWPDPHADRSASRLSR